MSRYAASANGSGLGFAQTTLRKVVGQHTLDQTLSGTGKINLDIRKILDVSTAAWGVEVTLVELKDIQLPDSMKRAMARQAEAELMSTIAELGSFIAHEQAAALPVLFGGDGKTARVAAANGSSTS